MTESSKAPLRSVDRRDLSSMEAYYLARIEALQAEIQRLHVCVQRAREAEHSE